MVGYCFVTKVIRFIESEIYILSNDTDVICVCEDQISPSDNNE